MLFLHLKGFWAVQKYQNFITDTGHDTLNSYWQ